MTLFKEADQPLEKVRDDQAGQYRGQCLAMVRMVTVPPRRNRIRMTTWGLKNSVCTTGE